MTYRTLAVVAVVALGCALASGLGYEAMGAPTLANKLGIGSMGGISIG
ncbi:MAG: hypothetical protein WBD60_04305 [Methylovirgula sp.]